LIHERLLLSYGEAEAYVHVSHSTMQRAVRQGRIPHLIDPLTGKVRFEKHVLDEFFKGHRQGASK
jgi:excisionase family DNA binding protein